MKTYTFTVVIEADEGGFHAYVPLLPGCHSFAATMDEARTNVIKAVRLHLAYVQEGRDMVPDGREPFFAKPLSVPLAA